MDGVDNDEDGLPDCADPDDDDDGLPDVVEVELGTNPLAADSDGDGDADLIELIVGADPTDATSTVTDPKRGGEVEGHL